MAASEGFSSCNLCGATFHGEAVPQHPCLSSAYVAPAPMLGAPSPFYAYPSLTLRDYFAGQAMQAFLGNMNRIANPMSDGEAVMAFRSADAMLKAREK